VHFVTDELDGGLGSSRGGWRRAGEDAGSLPPSARARASIYPCGPLALHGQVTLRGRARLARQSGTFQPVLYDGSDDR